MGSREELGGAPPGRVDVRLPQTGLRRPHVRRPVHGVPHLAPCDAPARAVAPHRHAPQLQAQQDGAAPRHPVQRRAVPVVPGRSPRRRRPTPLPRKAVIFLVFRGFNHSENSVTNTTHRSLQGTFIKEPQSRRIQAQQRTICRDAEEVPSARGACTFNTYAWRLLEFCPQLKHYKHVKQVYGPGKFFDIGPHYRNMEAFAIARLPRLLSLQLVGDDLDNAGLSAILENCPHLELLDLRNCPNIHMDSSLVVKCAQVNRKKPWRYALTDGRVHCWVDKHASSYDSTDV